MSWYKESTASALDISRYSLYMLCVPERESYRIQMPKFLTFVGRFSCILSQCQPCVIMRGRRSSRTWLIEMTSPLVFLIFFNFVRKYQNLDFATTIFGANIRMRKSFGVGLESVGRCRPMTWYSLRRPVIPRNQLSYCDLKNLVGCIRRHAEGVFSCSLSSNVLLFLDVPLVSSCTHIRFDSSKGT